MSKIAIPAIAMAAGLALASAAMAQVPPGAPIVPAPVQPNQGANNPVPPAAGVMSEADVRATLQKQGYSQVVGMQLNGSEYAVRAMIGQQGYVVLVDAYTGQVKSSNPG